MLIFGSAAAELASAGKIYGVDPHTGQRLWVFDVIKKDPESRPEEEAAKYGGGGAWLPGSYDAETDAVFYGTSNPAADAWGEDRKGDNLYTGTVLALEPRTGKLKWYRQEIEHDLWDFDSAYEFPPNQPERQGPNRSPEQERLRVRHGQARRQGS